MGQASCPDTTWVTSQDPILGSCATQHTWLTPGTLCQHSPQSAGGPEPTKAESKGEKAWVGTSGYVCGGVSAGPHREETPEAGVGPGAKTGLRPPIW